MPLTAESDGVRSYLGLMQGIIDRLASNSASCKTWCVTLASGLTVLAIDKAKPDAILIGLIPVGMFFFLDGYYLSLERDFRETYDGFVKKLHEARAVSTDLYVLKPLRSGLMHRIAALISTVFSLSIIPFYGVLSIAMVLARKAISR